MVSGITDAKWAATKLVDTALTGTGTVPLPAPYGIVANGDTFDAVELLADVSGSGKLEPLGGPIGRLTWIRWRVDVRLDEPGQILFMARAADGDGVWQDEELSEPFPAGASGYPRVPMRVYAGVGDPGPA